MHACVVFIRLNSWFEEKQGAPYENNGKINLPNKTYPSPFDNCLSGILNGGLSSECFYSQLIKPTALLEQIYNLFLF